MAIFRRFGQKRAAHHGQIPGRLLLCMGDLPSGRAGKAAPHIRAIALPPAPCGSEPLPFHVATTSRKNF